jgi:biotin transport system ATP-binding protein
MNSFLEVRNLSYQFSSGHRVLHNISFSLGKGSFTVLAGPNGSGKTVLMKNLNGLYQPTTGEILLEGESVNTRHPRVRQRIGLVFQDPDSCIVGQTVAEDAAFGLENLGLPRDEIDLRIDMVLNQLDLLDKRHFPPRFLSGGEKKKLTLGGILVMQPDLIILDEPFVGLDYPGVREILSLITGLHKEGKTILVITHDLEKVLAHADRLLLLHEGSLAAQGTPEKLLDRLESLGIRRPPERKVEEMTWMKNSSSAL